MNNAVYDYTSDVYEELEELKSRIEKAVEYINSGIGKSLKEEYCCFGILLNILNGRSDE